MTTRRDQILETALELLAQGGPKSLSHRAVDRALRIPMGSTANYFSTRHSLVDAILERVTELESEAYLQVDPGAAGGDVPSVVEHLTTFVRMAATGHLATRSRAILALAIGGDGVALRGYRTKQIGELAQLLEMSGVDDPGARAATVSDYMDGVVTLVSTGQLELDEDGIRTAIGRLLA